MFTDICVKGISINMGIVVPCVAYRSKIGSILYYGYRC
jgi:hypothetical protein